MEKLLLSVSLVFFMVNIDEIYGPLRKQKLQHVGRTYMGPEANSQHQNKAEV